MASRSSSEEKQSPLPHSSKSEVASTRGDVCDVCYHKTNAGSSNLKSERMPSSDDSKFYERTSNAPLSKGVTRPSECHSLPENSTSSQALYPSLKKYQDHDTFKSTPSASYRKEEDMIVDDGDDRGQFLGISQDKLKKLDVCNQQHFLDMAICKSNHIDIAETAKAQRNVSSPPRSADQKHVNMPFYQKRGSDERWKTIKEALRNVKDGYVLNEQLKEHILSYNGSYKSKWDFDGLTFFCGEMMEKYSAHQTKTDSHKDSLDIFTILSKMAELALSIESIVPTQIPFLKRKQDQSIALSKRQIACLLAHAFFCTYPMRNADPVKDKYSFGSDSLPLPTINFSSMFKFNNVETTRNKLLCIFNYFRRIETMDTDKKVIFKRQSIKPGSFKWKESKKRFTQLHVATYGQIEKQKGFLQVDFANKFVGGGVLGRGCVQEEIWFLASPELIVSRLFTEGLEPNEVLLITGSEIYNTYRGYSNTFEWTGNFVDQTRSIDGVKVCQMVAMDAKKYYQDDNQFNMGEVDRELNKAYCGFYSNCKKDVDQLPAVATGNWGCGAFNGDRHLKSLIQMMAAAEAGRDICYFTHGDKELMQKMHDVHSLFTFRNITVGNVYEIIGNYVARVEGNVGFLYSTKLYDYILTTFGDVKFSQETSV